jgi:hypothetical protein
MKINDNLNKNLVVDFRNHHRFVKGCTPDFLVERAEQIGLLSHLENTLVSARGAAWEACFIKCYTMSDQMAETAAGSRQEILV